MTISPEQVEKFAEYAAAKSLRRSVTSGDSATEIPYEHTIFVTDPHGTEVEQENVESVNAYCESVIKYWGHLKSASATFYLTFPTLASTSDFSVKDETFRIQQSPFEELYDLQSNEERLKELFEYIEDTLDISFNRHLVRRLRKVQESANEEESGHAPMSSGSLQNLVSFLSKGPKDIKYPDITLTPRGNIYLNWHANEKRNLAVEFLSSSLTLPNSVRLVLFYPDSSDPTSMIRLSGSAPTSNLIKIAESNGALAWILE